MMCDSYSHSLSATVYTPENIPGPGCSLALFTSDLAGCECTLRCQNACDHLLKFGRNYELGGLMPGAFNYPVFECNDKCNCNPSLCANRLVQFGPCKSLEVVKLSKAKGLGVITNKRLMSGEFVVCYAGEILGLDVARARIERETRRQETNYIIVVREHTGDSKIETIVDPTMIGNIGRYINHSCEPNLVMVPVRIDSMVPNLALFATKDIADGEELTFNYGGSVHDNDHAKDNFKQSSGEFQDSSMTRIQCLCKSEHCEGFVPFDPSLF